MIRKKQILQILLTLCTVFEFTAPEVRMIQATIRHGDRNPLDGSYSASYYPNDPYKDNDWFPDGPMELTNAGKQNAFKLGQFLRERYTNLVGAVFKPREVRFHSAQMTRAISTIQAVAAGLFPPVQSQKWNPQLSWIPVPIYVVRADEDKLNYAMGFCENYHIDRQKSSVEVDRLVGVLTDVQAMFNFLSVHTGVNYTNPTQGWILYHQFAAQASLGLKFDPWISEIFPNGKLVDISAIEYIVQTYTDRMKRLVGGAWIKEFLDSSERLINGSSVKAQFHATNEIQVAAILNALGVYKPHIPSYASAIIFELHEIQTKFYVKVIYRNDDKVLELIIPGCETICPLATFKMVLENVTLNDFKADCGRLTDFEIIRW